MSPVNKIITNIYNPLNFDKESLLDHFVVRHKEFNRIYRDIKSSKLNQSSQNFLIQGQRGSGKTTLLAKLRFEMEADESLSHLLVIQFTEEQYNVFTLNRLWEAVADILEDMPGFKNIVDEMEHYDDEDDYFSLISRYLTKNQKKLVLLIDNFGDILDKLKEIEHKKLRDILHESDLQIIAASTRTLEAAYKHDKPFFESFNTIYLEALTKTDVQTLLEHLARRHGNLHALAVIQHQKGRIEAIRRLTGGIPRTIILLYELITDDSADVFEDLEGILDKMTPLYKHKMDDLPTQQQVIVDAIASHWDGILTSEISKTTRLPAKAISAQLKLLEKNGLVISSRINKKTKLYMLEERFFNIWYLMRYGRKRKKQQVLWLVSFLKEWCSDEDLARKAQIHMALAKSGELNRWGCYYMAEALAQSLRDPELRYEIVVCTKAHLAHTNPELAGNMSDTWEMAWEVATSAYDNGDFKKVEKYFQKGADEGDSLAMTFLGLLYETEYKDYEKAEKYYLMAADKGDENAMFQLGYLYQYRFDNHKMAEKYYLKIQDKTSPALWYNLCLLYDMYLQNSQKAIAFYHQAVEQDFNDHMAFLLGATFHDDEIQKAFLKLFEKFSSKEDYPTLLALSILLIHNGDFKKAANVFMDFLNAIEKSADFHQHISNFLILLMARKQFHLAHDIFEDKRYQLNERIKPVYFALMKLMHEEHPKEFKRMGAEVGETVNEVLAKINTLKTA
ncbi:MAG: NACHT domain-containing protein [Deltaproteobacteria bacterium]|nr:NACHT domain-containing protein [Deltaproteobacteria bacterium]